MHHMLYPHTLVSDLHCIQHSLRTSCFAHHRFKNIMVHSQRSHDAVTRFSGTSGTLSALRPTTNMAILESKKGEISATLSYAAFVGGMSLCGHCATRCSSVMAAASISMATSQDRCTPVKENPSCTGTRCLQMCNWRGMLCTVDSYAPD
jgi:hypothetical protein